MFCIPSFRKQQKPTLQEVGRDLREKARYLFSALQFKNRMLYHSNMAIPEDYFRRCSDVYWTAHTFLVKDARQRRRLDALRLQHVCTRAEDAFANVVGFISTELVELTNLYESIKYVFEVIEPAVAPFPPVISCPMMGQYRKSPSRRRADTW